METKRQEHNVINAGIPPIDILRHLKKVSGQCADAQEKQQEE